MGAMASCSGTYVLAVPRALRLEVRADWQERVRELGGLAPYSPASPHRMQIEADEAALARIEAEFGRILRIEPISIRAADVASSRKSSQLAPKRPCSGPAEAEPSC